MWKPRAVGIAVAPHTRQQERAPNFVVQPVELRKARLRVNFERLHPGSCYPLETAPNLPLVRNFLAVARQKRPAGADFFSDAGVLSAGGIPAVLFGPGDIAQAHTPDEWIPQEQLEQGKSLLLRFLQSLP